MYGSFMAWSKSFDGALVLAITASVLLNVAFGALAYATFGRALVPPLLPGSPLTTTTTVEVGAGDMQNSGAAAKGDDAESWSRSDEVEGCDSMPPYMCDDVVKNVNAGPLKVQV
jgi:hypothetical protein